MSQGESIGYKNQKKKSLTIYTDIKESIRERWIWELNMKIAPTKIINENFFSILYTFVNLFLCFLCSLHIFHVLIYETTERKKILRFFFSLLVKIRFISFRAIHSFILFCFFGVSHFYRPDLCDKNIKLSWYNLHSIFSIRECLKVKSEAKINNKEWKIYRMKKISWAH